MKEANTHFTLGVEEEMWLVHRSSGELCHDWPEALLKICHQKHPDSIVREFIKSQVELITSPCQSIHALAEEIYGLRQFMADKANDFDLTLMAASTHPTAYWREHEASTEARYQILKRTLQSSARRMLVGGMHVHIGIPDPEQRLSLCNRMIPFLPYILALSTSSPFWACEDSGLNSYRLSVINGLPRSGFPPLFNTIEAFQNYLNKLIQCKVIESGRELWWDMRLSARYPTVEVRVADTCTNAKDALAIAAFIQALARYLSRQKETQKTLVEWYQIALENRWRAQRYPIRDSKLLSMKGERLMSFSTLLNEILDKLEPDAIELGSEEYLVHCRKILEQGTSADKQRGVFQKAKSQGLSDKSALKKVQLHLMSETIKEERLEYAYSNPKQV